MKSEINKLTNISPDKEFWNGSIFRLYDVDRIDSKNNNDDFYDFMLIDMNLLATNTFAFINVTIDSGNKGKVFALIENIETKYFIKANDLQKHFDPVMELYYIPNWKQVLL